MKRLGLLCVLVLLVFGLFAKFKPETNAALTADNWVEEVTGLPFSDIKHVATDSNGRIFAVKHSSPYQVWRSVDRGASWTKVFENVSAITYAFVDGRDHIYAYSKIIWRSTDHGDSWSQVLSADASQLWHMDEDSSGNLYTNTYDALSGKDYIYRSIDSGGSWSIWYNVTASPNPVRHIHSVDVAPNDYVFVCTGDEDTGQIDDNTIRRWNGTAWKILAESTSATDREPRATTMWFIGDYVYTCSDGAEYNYRFPITGTWAEREKIVYVDSLGGTKAFFWSQEVGDVAFVENGDGKLFVTWDGVHYAKIHETTGAVSIQLWLQQHRVALDRFPFYFVDTHNDKLYRVNQMTKEDAVQLYYKTFNSERSLVTNQDNYVLEQRLHNGSNSVDLTQVALTNVQATIEGLTRRNLLSNSGFESGDTTGWTILHGSAQASVTVEDKYSGSYSLKVIKSSTDAFTTHVQQDVTVTKGENHFLFSWAWKSNASATSALYPVITNQSSGGTLIKGFYFTSVTSWTNYTWVVVWNSSSTWTMRMDFQFKRKDVTTYLDATLATLHESSYAKKSPNVDVCHCHYLNNTPFLTNIDTLNPSLTVAGQSVSHSGTLTNGSSSSTKSLTGTFTGAIQVAANIQGSGQAILRLTGTRLLYEDSIILKTRTNEIYYGRYYGTFSPIVTTSDLIAVTNLASNITTISYANYELTFTVDSPSGATSTTKVYVGGKGEPSEVNGATSWNYDVTNSILTIAAIHSGPITVTIKWKLLGDVNSDNAVNSTDLVLFSNAYGSRHTDPNWNANADTNGDGIVNVQDLWTLSKNYGKSL